MPEKPKIGLYWCASCGGCEESVVDLAEDILAVVAAVDICLWPVGMDFKKSDVIALPDGGLVATMINGAIRTSEQEEMAHLLRKKSRIIIAYGSCAHLGGIPGLANQFPREQILQYVFHDSPTTENPEGTRPRKMMKNNGHEITLPSFYPSVRALDQVIDVDYYLPGCPPTPKLLKEAINALLSGKLPPKGAVLAPDIAMCDTCPRKDTKPSDLKFKEFKRPHWTNIDPELCLLAQGLLCMGPATRGGCDAACVRGNMPCSGCFGPTSRIKDQGAKIMTAIVSSIDAMDDETADKILATIPDPIGTFYRYGLPKSLLRMKAQKQ